MSLGHCHAINAHNAPSNKKRREFIHENLMGACPHLRTHTPVIRRDKKHRKAGAPITNTAGITLIW